MFPNVYDDISAQRMLDEAIDLIPDTDDGIDERAWEKALIDGCSTMRPLDTDRLLPGDPIGDLDGDIRHILEVCHSLHLSSPSMITQLIRTNCQNLRPEIVDALSPAAARAFRRLRRDTVYGEFTDPELVRALQLASPGQE